MNFLLTCAVVLLLASNVELVRKARRRKVDVVGAFTEANIQADSNVTAPKGFLQVLLVASNVDFLRKAQAHRKINLDGAFTDAIIQADSNVAAPKRFLHTQVTLSENIKVNLGNEIFYGDTSVLTSIGFYNTPGYFNTLIVVDLDFPSGNNSYQSPLLLHMVVNIVGVDLEAADVVTKYVAPNPPPDSGIHRIVYYFFSQEYKIDVTSISYLQISRRSFPLADFIADNGLQLVAGNFYRDQYPGLQALCEGYNCIREEDCIAIII